MGGGGRARRHSTALWFHVLSPTTDKKKLRTRLNGTLEAGFPGSMGERQKEGFEVFRAYVQYAQPSESCLAENNAKTRLQSDCLTGMGGGVLPQMGRQPHTEGRDKGI